MTVFHYTISTCSKAYMAMTGSCYCQDTVLELTTESDLKLKGNNVDRCTVSCERD